MKKVMGILSFLLVMIAFTGITAAASTTTSYSTWQSDYHPYIGKIMSKSTETDTINLQIINLFQK